MQIILVISGRHIECKVGELHKKIKEFLPQATGITCNVARVKQALKEGHSGRVNSADGYQISYKP